MATSSILSPTMLYRDFEDDTLEIPDDPAKVFGEVVERNDCVCRNCYRRLRRKATFPQTAGLDYGDVLSYVDWVSPTGSEWDLLDREYYERLKLPQRLGPAYSDDGKTPYCKNCGTMDPHRTPTTRSKQNARDVAINLTTTLHELGIDHDWVYLVERVVELKSQPGTAGDDFICFRRSTAEAIQTVKE